MQSPLPIIIIIIIITIINQPQPQAGIGFLVGFGLLAALIFTFPFDTDGGGLLVLAPVEAGLGWTGFGVLLRPPVTAPGLDLGAGGAEAVLALVGFVGALPLADAAADDAGAGKAFFVAPTGFDPALRTCFVAAAEGLGCAEPGRIFLEAFVTIAPGAEASGNFLSP